MANERLTSILGVDPMLQAAIGPIDIDGIPRAAEGIAPRVEVFTSKFLMRKFGKDALRKQPKTKRPLGGTYERITFSTSTISGTVEEHGLKTVVDRRERQDAENSGNPNAAWNLRQTAALFVRSQVLNGKEWEASQTLQDVAKYGANNSADIANFGLTGVRKWFNQYRQKIRQSIGRNPTALLIAEDKWWDLQNNPDIVKNFNYGADAGQYVTEAMVASYLGLKGVTVGASAALDDKDNPTELWSAKAILAYVNPQAGLYGPTFAKSFFRRIGPVAPGMTEQNAGVVLSAFDEVQNETIAYAEEYSNGGCEIVYPDAGWLFHA